LTEATAPVVSKNAATTPGALKAAKEHALGAGRYRLLGLWPFNPAAHAGHKVAAKGVLTQSQNDSRLNVTSLQSVADSCR